jgi:hypothetical protein
VFLGTTYATIKFLILATAKVAATSLAGTLRSTMLAAGVTARHGRNTAVISAAFTGRLVASALGGMPLTIVIKALSLQATTRFTTTAVLAATAGPQPHTATLLSVLAITATLATARPATLRLSGYYSR